MALSGIAYASYYGLNHLSHRAVTSSDIVMLNEKIGAIEGHQGKSVSVFFLPQRHADPEKGAYAGANLYQKQWKEILKSAPKAFRIVDRQWRNLKWFEAHRGHPTYFEGSSQNAGHYQKIKDHIIKFEQQVGTDQTDFWKNAERFGQSLNQEEFGDFFAGLFARRAFANGIPKSIETITESMKVALYYLNAPEIAHYLGFTASFSGAEGPAYDQAWITLSELKDGDPSASFSDFLASMFEGRETDVLENIFRGSTSSLDSKEPVLVFGGLHQFTDYHHKNLRVKKIEP